MYSVWIFPSFCVLAPQWVRHVIVAGVPVAVHKTCVVLTVTIVACAVATVDATRALRGSFTAAAANAACQASMYTIRIRVKGCNVAQKRVRFVMVASLSIGVLKIRVVITATVPVHTAAAVTGGTVRQG